MTMDNTALLATSLAGKHADQLRRWAITDAVRALMADDPQRAYERVLHSVLGEQARTAGIRVEVQP